MHEAVAFRPNQAGIGTASDVNSFSTPFDASAVKFLEELNVPVHKIASFEIVDLQLLRVVAATGKPIILSAGMATLEEIEEAVRTIQEAGGEELALLKCTSAYPARPEDMNLRTIPNLATRFVVRDVKQGETFTLENVRSIRPGHGLHPRHFEEVLGRTAAADVARGTPLERRHVSEN